jgi:hypothetical protein
MPFEAFFPEWMKEEIVFGGVMKIHTAHWRRNESWSVIGLPLWEGKRPGRNHHDSCFM